MGCLQEAKGNWMKAKATLMSLLRKNHYLDFVINFERVSKALILKIWHSMTKDHSVQEGIRICTQTLSNLQRMDSKEWKQTWGQKCEENEACILIFEYNEEGSSWNFSVWAHDSTSWKENNL